MLIRSTLKSTIRSTVRSVIRGGIGGLTFPRTGLLINSKAYDADAALMIDKVGANTRTIQPLQYMDCDGTGYFASAAIVGNETVISYEGTATPSIAAGRLNATAGTLWSVVLSNGSRYEFATKTGDTSAVAFDVSGSGRHLTATGFADLDVLCGSGMVEGSDWLNRQGYSAAPLGLFFDNDPSQYIEIPRTDAIQMLDGVMTVLVWMNCFGNTGASQIIWAASAGGGAGGYGIRLSSANSFRLETYGADNGRQDSTYTGFSQYSGKNLHIAAHFGRTSQVVDIDGVNRLNSTILDPGTVTTETDTILVGRYPSTSIWPFWGMFYGIALFNRELSAAEKAHFQTHRPIGTEDGCVGYWPMDEGSGTVVHDLSSEANHGTIVGGLPWRQLAPIPALTDQSTDALGNTLDYPGRAKYNVVPALAPCATIETGTSIAMSGVTGATILSKEGTGTVSIGTDTIDWATDGTLYNLKLTLTDGKVLTIPFVESEGTTVYGYDDTGVVFTGTITTADIEVFWGGKQSTFFHGLEFGCNKGRWDIVSQTYTNEPTRTNKLLYSQDFTRNYYNTRHSIISILSTIPAPDGTLTAYVLASTSSTSYFGVKSVSENGDRKSIWARTVSGTGKVTLLKRHQIAEALFDITEEWQRFELSTDVTEELGGHFYAVDFRSADATLSEVVLWQGQVEVGAEATSPIVTTDAAVTAYSGTITPANPHTPGLDVLGNPLVYPPGRFNPSASYTLESPEVFEALGESDFFDADGVSLPISYDDLLLYAGNQVWMDEQKGLAVYDDVQVGSMLTKVQRYYRISAINNIGIPGNLGFGVGICPVALPSDMVEMTGTRDPASDNYGNYQYADGSIMCWVPAFYYRLHADNSVDIKPYQYFADLASAHTAGYTLHRAFYDGGEVKQGFFIDKYMCSNNAGVASSIKDGACLSSSSAHNGFSTLTGSHANNYSGIFTAAKTRGEDFFPGSIFQHGALALLSLAHGQAAASDTWCAWYDSTQVTNFPKGCNNNALGDVDDGTISYTAEGYLNCGLTGSGVPVAKTTHNGQACGVADLNGNMYWIAPGLTCVAVTRAITGMTLADPCVINLPAHGLDDGDLVRVYGIAAGGPTALNGDIFRISVVDPDHISLDGVDATTLPAWVSGGTVQRGIFYLLTTSASMASLTGGTSADTDHWGAAGLAAHFQATDLRLNTAWPNNGYVQRFGNGGNQVLSTDLEGASWAQAGAGLPVDGGISTSGSNLFGVDYCYQYIVNDLCPIVGGHWSANSAAGVWMLNLVRSRGYSYDRTGLRAALYL